jgi:predicted metalloprotease with PDZ domain
METRRRSFAFCVAIYVALPVASAACAEQPESGMSFVVSMDNPETQRYHVEFRCDGLNGPTQDFKMPVWTPGYYGVLNNAENVESFTAEDGSGVQLKWEKTTKNTWMVQSDQATSMTVSYDVKATNPFIANSYLDENRGYISPVGVFMHPAGRLRQPVTVVLRLYSMWNTMATGLEPVDRRPHMYRAADFDVLYDCPILMGNLETLPAFEVQGIPHRFVGYNLGAFDRGKFIADLKRIVEAAVSIVGEIPYKHYTFLAVGPGMGGLEHSNSAALSFSRRDLSSPDANARWLSFVTHEYFHLYNMKAIRPIALGPFDYDTENYTNMLWFSEGGTVYYQHIILNRAGFMSRSEVLDALSKAIAAYENNPGHLCQSAVEASRQTWTEPPFGKRPEGVNKTISYYDKGAALSALLDLKIRHETKNVESLDDVMRTLYQTYYKEKRRGFADLEFREACEQAAGCPLDEFFEYASTAKAVDYPKYFGYAGLEIEMPPEVSEADSGAPAKHEGAKSKKSGFSIKPKDNPDALQSTILNAWLKQ